MKFKIVLINSLPLALPFLGLLAASAREPLDRPNVVLFYPDDNGYGDYSHNGNPVIETPNISKLAAGGVNFTQFYVTSPACSASRYPFLTSHYPGLSGFGGWVIGPEAKPHLRTEETTLADGFKSRGYTTGMCGKWHLGTPNPGNAMTPDALPLAHGFDMWIGTNVSHDSPHPMTNRCSSTSNRTSASASTAPRNIRRSCSGC